MASDRTRESALWGWLREAVKRLAGQHKCDVQRIENAVSTGTPDVEGCIDGGQFWIELKVAYEQPTRGTVRVKTTAEQVYFAVRRRQVGGLSWYLIRVGTHPNWSHYLVPGQHAEELLDRPVALERLRRLSPVDPRSRPEALMTAASRVEGAFQLE